MSNEAYMTDDLFFLDLDNDRIIWVYHNPDATVGGQFVTNYIGRAFFKDAMRGRSDPADVFDYIGSGCRQLISDVGTEEYAADLAFLKERKPFAVGCTAQTLQRLGQAFEARYLINDFCWEAFGCEGNFSDPTAIGVAYTTVDTTELPVQAYVDIEGYRIDRYFCETLVERRQYDSLKELIDGELKYLDFDDLTYVSDEQIQQYIEEPALEP